MSVRILDAEAGVVCAEPTRSKVAIIGAAHTTRPAAPFDDPTWECWGLNQIRQPRVDRWFELHPWEVQTEAEQQWLRDLRDIPVYMLERHREVPMSMTFPLTRIAAMFGAKPYFSCTFAYQIALAVSEGFTTIGLFGVELPLGNPRERTVERACVEWWQGYAAGRGIDLVLPEGSTLSRHPGLYGYDYDDEKATVERMMESFFGVAYKVERRSVEEIAEVCGVSLAAARRVVEAAVVVGSGDAWQIG